LQIRPAFSALQWLTPSEFHNNKLQKQEKRLLAHAESVRNINLLRRSTCQSIGVALVIKFIVNCSSYMTSEYDFLNSHVLDDDRRSKATEMLLCPSAMCSR